MAPDQQASDIADTRRLHEMGYAQTLLRRMGAFSNFAVSFTIISVMSGTMTLYGYGMATGGPATITWGWLLVGVMVIVVGLAVAELASAYPTAAGPYYWSAQLGGRHAALWSWFTGWFNLLGQFGITAGIDFGLALFVAAELNLRSGYSTDPPHVIAIFVVVLLIHGLLNMAGIRSLARLFDFSAWWHVLGIAVIVAVLALKPAHHQSASFVFTHFVNQTGWGSMLYVFLLGLLLAQYTFTGFDASAHLAEETREAGISVPRGIVWSIIVSLVGGWILLLGVTFAIQRYNPEIHSSTGVPPAQIFVDAVGQTGAEFLLLIVIVAQFCAGLASVSSHSRLIYAFARDGALPGSGIWKHVTARTRAPASAAWLAVAGALILGLPYLISNTAYVAATSIAVIGLYLAYIAPVFLRLRAGQAFRAGPWTLGRWSRPVGSVAVIWVIIISVLFMLPTVSPVTGSNFNYTVVAVAVAVIFAGGWWLLGARRWFTGPRSEGSQEELRSREEAVPVGDG